MAYVHIVDTRKPKTMTPATLAAPAMLSHKDTTAARGLARLRRAILALLMHTAFERPIEPITAKTAPAQDVHTTHTCTRVVSSTADPLGVQINATAARPMASVVTRTATMGHMDATPTVTVLPLPRTTRIVVDTHATRALVPLLLPRTAAILEHTHATTTST